MSAVAQQGSALAPGTVLLWYEIQQVIGQGAFGITYLAQDTNLRRQVAIKEFLPGQLARREGTGTVEALTDSLAPEFAAGLQSFITEARTLARFEHPGIVRVHNVFEANGTACMVMRYEEGEGLERILKRRGTLEESELLGILHPLLAGLEVIHAEGFLHRDIKPGNIFIRRDGTPFLLDFGSARQTAATGEARTLTSFVSPGYAPIEQYSGRSDQQGPWTDIYGLGATAYRAMTGRPPTDAVERSHTLAQDSRDSYETLPPGKRYSSALVTAVEAALRFGARDRPQSIAVWRALLPPPPGTAPLPTAAPPARATGGADISETDTTIRATAPASPAPDRGHRKLFLGVTAVVATVVLVLLVRPGDNATAPGVAPAGPAATPAPGTVVDATVDPPPGEGSPPQAATAIVAAIPARVEALLDEARLDLEALRLMSPAGRNAHEKYREVLALDPGNADAGKGIEAITDRYVGLAYRDLEQQQFERAGTYLARAAKLLPERESVADARKALDSARAAAATNESATTAAAAGEQGQKLQDNFDAFVREQQSRPKTRGQELIDRLGGGR